MSVWKTSVPMMRIPQFLQDREIPFETLIHPPAYTAEKRLDRINVPGDRLAASRLVTMRNRLMLAVFPVSHELCLPTLSSRLGGDVLPANAPAVSGIFRDCEWGAVGPFGRLYDVPTFLDDSLDLSASIFFEAHFHSVTIRMSGADYLRVERPKQLSFATRPSIRND